MCIVGFDCVGNGCKCGSGVFPWRVCCSQREIGNCTQLCAAAPLNSIFHAKFCHRGIRGRLSVDDLNKIKKDTFKVDNISIAPLRYFCLHRLNPKTDIQFIYEFVMLTGIN